MKKLLTLVIFGLLSFSLISCSSTPSNNNKTDEPKKVETVKELVTKFQEAKIAATDPRDMKASDFGMAPKLTDESMIFKIDVEKDQNARVFKFKNQEDLNKTKSYYDELGKGSAMLFSHTYAKGNFLIQANGELTKEIFAKYTKVIDDNIK